MAKRTNGIRAEEAEVGQAKKLTPKQIAWLTRNGIAAKAGEHYGWFYTTRGITAWISPLPENLVGNALIYVHVEDRSEDSDGERTHSVHKTYKGALGALARLARGIE